MTKVEYKLANGIITDSYQEALASNQPFEIRYVEEKAPYQPNPTLERIIAKKFPVLSD